jgi:DNA-binding transcriptional LysR family regulator
MSWSDLRVFLTVCRAGSTLAASKQLGMSQPTVARRIDALEHHLGLTLFERDTHGFKPTLTAKALLPFVEKMEAAADEVNAVAQQARNTKTRAIRITAPRRNFSPTFSAILSEFSLLNPDIRFELIANYQVLDLIAGEADVAIRIAREVTDKRLICTKLTDVKSALFASRDYAERHGLPVSPDQLAGHRFVVYDPVPPTMLLNDWLLERIAPDQIVTRGGDVESVTTSIDAGLGIGPVTIAFAADYPALVRCFDPPPGTDVSSWLVMSPEAYRRPEVRAFAAFFAPRFRAAYKAMREKAMVAQAYHRDPVQEARPKDRE